MSSPRSVSRRSVLKSAAIGSGALLLGKSGFASPIDASTAVRPYAVPSTSGVQIKAILTTGDAVNGYRMVGIPDGLGALRHGNTLELFMNHELTAAAPGIVRSHGS